MHRLQQVYKLNTYELQRRAGEMKEYELDIEVPEMVGVELICVRLGEIIEVDARLELESCESSYEVEGEGRASWCIRPSGADCAP